MQKLKHFLLTATLLLCSLAASAHDFEVGGIYYNITSSTDLTVSVTYRGRYYNSYSNEYGGAVTIPPTVTYNGYTYSVTSIGGSAFYACSSLTAITIPASVTSIGYGAFDGCSSLTAITIPESVTSIEKYAFNGTAWYDDQPDGVLYIGKMLYNYKGNMPENTAIEVKEGTVSISPCAFQSCSNLTAITIPESVTSIGDWAFDGCIGLTDITIPGSVSLIRDGAFANCTGLTSIIIPESMTSIANFAFYYCRGLISITIPASVTSIGAWAFEGCSSLTAITIPEGVTSIGSSAFNGCRSLTTITVAEGNAKYDSRGGCNAIIETNSNTLIAGCSTTIIPESVTSIGGSAFYACSSLTAITIPASVTSIGGDAFEDCSSLTVITIPESVTSIGDDAFRGCWNLTAITIPASVTSIGDYTFSGCSSLTAINIPEGVTSIGKSAFSGCSSLTAITCEAKTPPTLEGSYVFDRVNKSIPIYVPAGSVEAYKAASYWSEFANIQPIPSSGIASGTCGDNLTWRLTEEYELIIEGTGAMYDFSSDSAPWYEYRESIKAVTINEGATSIGDYAFFYCSSLTAITIPEGVTSIGGYAFCACNLSSIRIPASVKSIGEAAFANCGEVEEIIVASGNVNYDSRDNCNAIIETSSGQLITGCISTIIPEGVTSIGIGAFAGLDGLLSIAIPESVTSIGSQAFSWCTGLTAITIPENSQLTSIKDLAFSACSSLTAITIPASVTSIGSSILSGCSSLTAITCEAKTPLTLEGSYVFSGVNKSIPLYVPAGSVEAYKAASYWSEFTNILPLPITITINQYGSGTYSSPYALDFSNVKVLRAYVATGYNHITGEVTLLRVHTAEAGTGLLVKGTPGVTYEVPIIESTADHTLNLLVATLEKTRVDKYSSDGMYANYKYTVIKSESPEPLFYPFADGSSLSAGKAYLQLPKAWLPEKENFVIRYRFDEGETTGFDDEQVTIDNQSSLAEGESNMQLMIYDLMGRRVLSPKKGGIYIINGRKVVY